MASNFIHCLSLRLVMQLLVGVLAAGLLVMAQLGWAISNVEADKPRLPEEGFPAPWVYRRKAKRQSGKTSLLRLKPLELSQRRYAAFIVVVTRLWL